MWFPDHWAHGFWGIADVSASQSQLMAYRRAGLSHVDVPVLSLYFRNAGTFSYFTNDIQPFHQHKEYKIERSGRDDRDSVARYRDGQLTTSDRSTCTARAPYLGASRAVFYWAASPSAVPGIITSTPAAIRFPVSCTTTYRKHCFGTTKHWSWFSHCYRCEADSSRG